MPTTNDYFKRDIRGGQYAGDHILIDLYGAVGLDQADWIQRVIEKACDIAGAEIILSKYKSFGENMGVSGSTILSESHASVHTWPERNFASVDVFMCGKANAFAAAQYIIAAFCPTQHSMKHERRGEHFRKAWGQHLSLDLLGCPEEVLRHEPTLRAWCCALVDAIKMDAYGDPLIKHFAEHNEEAAGYTLVQLIETSSITAHFAENIGEAYIDVFSCKSFDENKAIEVTKKLLRPNVMDKRSVMRG